MQDVPPDMIDLDNLNPEEDADPDTRETREELERRYIDKISPFYFENIFYNFKLFGMDGTCYINL